MSKFKRSLILVFMLVFVSVAAQTVFGFPIIIDDEPVEINIIVVDDRSLVPVRAFVELLGGEVDWNPDARRVDISKETSNSFLDNILEIVLYIDSNIAFVNGREVVLDVPAMIINGSTMVPLRFVTEALGMNVGFYDGTIFVNRSHIVLTYFMDVVQRGTDATLSILGNSNSRYHIGVEFLTGPSTAIGLGYAYSDTYGAVSWTWRVGSATTPGRWPITITGAPETTPLRVYFEVIE